MERRHFNSQRWGGFIQFIKFGLVGISNTAVSYISYLVFLSCGIHYLIASILSFLVSVTNSFYWNNKYVFSKGEGGGFPWWQKYIKTVTAYASTGLVLSNILLVIWVKVAEFPEEIAPLINLIITVPLNFFLNKYWAFRKK